MKPVPIMYLCTTQPSAQWHQPDGCRAVKVAEVKGAAKRLLSLSCGRSNFNRDVDAAKSMAAPYGLRRPFKDCQIGWAPFSARLLTNIVRLLRGSVSY